MSTPHWSFETRQIHAGQTPDAATGARALPIYQTTSFVFDSAPAGRRPLRARRSSGRSTRASATPPPDAWRTGSPPSRAASARCWSRRGRPPRPSRSSTSPRPATTSSPRSSLYGGTYNLLHYTLPKFGIEITSSTDPHDPQQWRDAVRPNTKAVLRRDHPQPQARRAGHRDASPAIAHEAGVPLIVDNTVATPYLIKPLQLGRRHRGALGDEVPRRARHRDRRRDRRRRLVRLRAGPRAVPDFNTPDPSLQRPGVRPRPRRRRRLRREPRVHPQGARPAAARPRPARSPRSTRSSSPRASRRCRCASSGTWPTPSRWPRGSRRATTCGTSTTRAWRRRRGTPTQLKYAPGGAGAVLSFELEGGTAAGQAFVSALELHSNVANIGDVRSLVIHPASTTHCQLTPEEQALSGVTPGLVRLAVGIEHIDDILADLEAGVPRRQGRVMAPPSRREVPAALRVLPGGRAHAGFWREGDPVGGRQFADLGPLDLEAGGHLPCGAARLRDVGHARRGPVQRRARRSTHSPATPTPPGPPAPGTRPPAGGTGLIGPGRPIDTDRWFVVVPNVLGGLPGVHRPVLAGPRRTAVGLAVPLPDDPRPGGRRDRARRRARRRLAGRS